MSSLSLEPNQTPTISGRDVEFAIRRLECRKAPGLDGVTAHHLRHLPARAIQLLVSVYNSCFRLGYFPSDWKQSKVICVCKPGKSPEEIRSYRLLSMLPILGKMLESMIQPHL